VAPGLRLFSVLGFHVGALSKAMEWAWLQSTLLGSIYRFRSILCHPGQSTLCVTGHDCAPNARLPRDSNMILGVVGRDPVLRPAWLIPLGLDWAGAEVPGTVHLGTSGPCSRFRNERVTVVAKSSLVSSADAGAVADAYQRFGDSCVRRLAGRFCFLLHDAEVGRVLAASSTAPPWPLHYWSAPHATIVSSRLLPLLRCPDVPRALDEPYLVHLVMGLSAMRDGSTAIRGVRRLLPGEALIVDAGGVRVSCVDSLAPRDIGGDRNRLGDAFIEELGRAMRVHTECGRAVVSFSGGLDSAALAAAGIGRGDHLAALSFVAPALDPAAEIGSIDAMARAWPGLRVTRVDASAASELPDLGTELRDDPPLTPLALLPARMQLWSRARDEGFRTVIEGEGGDELFSILPTPLDALRSGRVLRAARHVLGSSARRAMLAYGLGLPLLPGGIQRAWLARRQPIETYLPAFATWDASQHPIVREATDEYLATLVHRPFGVRLYEWLSAPMVVGAALSRRHVAAGFGLDLEWPMLDRGVLELVLGLHTAGAIQGGPERPFLRDALAGIAPDEVRLRPKNIGLYAALIPRLLTSPRAREALRDTRVRARLADLVRFERVDAMLDGLAAGRSLSMAAIWQLECLVGFAEWYGRASREYGVD
jgi:asparagine synthase (glutamine-hydrolysing)